MMDQILEDRFHSWSEIQRKLREKCKRYPQVPFMLRQIVYEEQEQEFNDLLKLGLAA